MQYPLPMPWHPDPHPLVLREKNAGEKEGKEEAEDKEEEEEEEEEEQKQGQEQEQELHHPAVQVLIFITCCRLAEYIALSAFFPQTLTLFETLLKSCRKCRGTQVPKYQVSSTQVPSIKNPSMYSVPIQRNGCNGRWRGRKARKVGKVEKIRSKKTRKELRNLLMLCTRSNQLNLDL